MDWRHQAACRDHDPELWFSGKPYEQAAALAICRSCPVIGECRRFADEPTRHPRRKNPPASATIEEKVKESQQTVENKPFPANPPRREQLRESKSPHLSAEARIVQQASIAPAKGRG